MKIRSPSSDKKDEMYSWISFKFMLMGNNVERTSLFRGYTICICRNSTKNKFIKQPLKWHFGYCLNAVVHWQCLRVYCLREKKYRIVWHWAFNQCIPAPLDLCMVGRASTWMRLCNKHPTIETVIYMTDSNISDMQTDGCRGLGSNLCR